MEVNTMTEEYSFPPFEDEMKKILDKFGGKRMETYQGEDITPLWDLKGEGLPWSCKYLYSAPKLEKIVFAVQSFRDKLMSYATGIWPDDTHALPIFSAYWAESAKGTYFVVDFYPTADCICDIPYMEHYLDPLEDTFNKGMEYFPSLSSGRNSNWFLALSSPYCLSGDFFPSTKETQRYILEIMTSYLTIYYDLWQKDQPRDTEYMKSLNTRKDAIRTNFREKDPGEYMMVKAVGKKLADLGLKVVF
jgi:hypothetical protein